MDYRHASGYEASQAEVATLVQRLQRNGWGGDPDFHSHSAVVKKNNVVAEFSPYHPNDNFGGITLYGECRDVTTTESTLNEPITDEVR